MRESQLARISPDTHPHNAQQEGQVDDEHRTDGSLKDPVHIGLLHPGAVDVILYSKIEVKAGAAQW